MLNALCSLVKQTFSFLESGMPVGSRDFPIANKKTSFRRPQNFKPYEAKPKNVRSTFERFLLKNKTFLCLVPRRQKVYRTSIWSHSHKIRNEEWGMRNEEKRNEEKSPDRSGCRKLHLKSLKSLKFEKFEVCTFMKSVSILLPTTNYQLPTTDYRSSHKYRDCFSRFLQFLFFVLHFLTQALC
jgi:hypothetical protein